MRQNDTARCASTTNIIAALIDAGDPLLIDRQGSFAVGGRVVELAGRYDPCSPTAAGQTRHGDHAYVRFQQPVNARKLPLVFCHGNNQSSRCWETTPDGREGFQNIFLRLGWSVFLADQARRGSAGRATVRGEVELVHDDAATFDVWRLGIWPEYFEGVRFSRDPGALEQLLRSIVPDTGPFDLDVIAAGTAALLDRIGDAVLITHSMGGGPGWAAAMRSSSVRAIVSYEPGSNFTFPECELPEPMASAGGPLVGRAVPMEEFLALTRIPIVLYYGDNIADEPEPWWGKDQWRVRLSMARRWRDVVNRYGGDVELVHLPAIGITGNTHFPFSDTNNVEIAALLAQWLDRKGLSGLT